MKIMTTFTNHRMLGPLTCLLSWAPAVHAQTSVERIPNVPPWTDGMDKISEKPISEQMIHAFSLIDLAEFDSGVLLDLGSLFSTDVVLAHDGTGSSVDESLTCDQFNDALGDLERSSFSGDDDLPDLETWVSRVEYWRQEMKMTPISLAVIDYERVEPGAYEDGRLTYDGEFYHEESSGITYWEERRFVATTIQERVIYGPEIRFILPSDLIVSNCFTPLEFLNIEIEFDGKPSIPISIDTPFEVSDLQPDTSGNLGYVIRFEVDDVQFQTAGMNPLELLDDFLGLHDYIDIGRIDGTIPFLGQVGAIDVRIYPATGRSYPLEKVIVVVDGFDLVNDRDQETIWHDFGGTLQKFRDLGFDLVVCDYLNGNDYIQRNGLAIREVLSRLPGWMKPGLEWERAVLLAGSMGTQTARYALVTAEQVRPAEDHHIGLFICIDGPFKGANVPISIQFFVEFLAPEASTVERKLAGLNSPAASQLLMVNRGVFGYYVPAPEFISYYAEADALGLPQKCRNVAVANGSGFGERVDPREFLRFLMVNKSGFLLDFSIQAYADRNGPVFHGYLRKLFHRRTYPDRQISGAKYIDLAPGGLATSARDTVDAWNEKSKILYGDMGTDQSNHCFIPTYSALSIDSSDVNYQPWTDTQIRSRSPFDAVHYELTNSLHVAETSGNLEFIVNELEAFCGKREVLLVGNLAGQALHGGSQGLGDIGDIGTQNIGAPDSSDSVPLDELLTINTRTHKAMIQRREGMGWKKLWENTGNEPWIGGWAINPGDKFFLADILGGPQDELICISAATPAWAMVQQFRPSGWFVLWHNGGNGLLSGWEIQMTDQYVFGHFRYDSDKEDLLAVYPYRFRSTAKLLHSSGSFWTTDWSNGDNNWVGGFPVLIGNQYSAANLDGDGQSELFTVDLHRNPIGWAVVQRFNRDINAWDWLYSDSEHYYGIIGPPAGGWYRNNGDSYQFADANGDGRDELHCFSGAGTPWAKILEFTPGVNSFWTERWHNDGSGWMDKESMDTYPLNPTYTAFSGDHARWNDEFVWGKLLEGAVSDSVLAVTPKLHGPAVQLRYQTSPDEWVPEWSDSNGRIGDWTLYE